MIIALVSGQAPSEPLTAMEKEVIQNIQNQSIGIEKVEMLSLPDDYLGRVAGRVIRSSFEERFRIVVPDSQAAPTNSPNSPATTDSATGRVGQSNRASNILVIAAAALLVVGVFVVIKGRPAS